MSDARHARQFFFFFFSFILEERVPYFPAGAITIILEL